MKRRIGLAIAMAFAMGAGAFGMTGCAPDADDAQELQGEAVDGEVVEGLADDGKDDSVSTLSATPFSDSIGAKGQTEVRKLFKTAAAYKTYFGHSAPASVNFSKHWVVFYSAGNKNSGGYEASVHKIKMNHTTGKLSITTRLVSPGPTCLVTEALTRPTVLARFNKPSTAPSVVSYFRSNQTTDCEPTCPAAVCTLACPFGVKVDDNGCDLCECNPGPTTCLPVLCELFCPAGFKTDAHGCSICECQSPPPLRVAATGQCVRNANDSCTTDADCTTGGCGGELCFNPAASAGFTTCDCSTPVGPSGCGCVNNRCSWYR